MPDRQHLYNRQIQAQSPNIHVPSVSAPPQVEGAGAGLLRAVAGAGSELLKIAGKNHVAEMRGRVDDAILGANAEFEKWKTEYKQNNQGALALDAQQVFADKYAEISQKYLDGLDAPANEIWRESLSKQFAQYGLHAIKEGGAWQIAQTEAWQKSQWQAQVSSYEQMIANNWNDPDLLALERNRLLQSWRDKNPGMDEGAIANQLQAMESKGRLDGMMTAEDYGGVKKLASGNYSGPIGGENIGNMLAHEESGSEGIRKIGYDKNGGTSYGKWQLSSVTDSFSEWLTHLAKSGDKGKAIAAEIRAAGPANTGSRKGSAVDAYLKHAVENPELFEKTQREYIIQNHYGPALKNIPAGARKLIESDGALQEMLFSTAVQHGGGGATRLVRKAWHDGMNAEQFVDALYAGRANPAEFKSSTAKVAASVTTGRMPRERDYVKSMLGKSEASGGAPLPGLTQKDMAAYAHAADMGIKHKQAEAKAVLVPQIRDYEHAAQDGKAPDMPFSREQVYAAYGPEQGLKAWDELQDLQALNDCMKRVQDSDATTLAGMVKAAAPKGLEGYATKRGFQEKLETRIKAELDARKKDPTAYLQKRNEALGEAYNNFLKQPSAETFSAYRQMHQTDADLLKLKDVPFFSKEQAKNFAAVIMSSPNPAMVLRGLQESTGQDWPKVFQELSAKDCLPVVAQLAAGGMAEQAGQKLLACARDKDFIKNSFELHKNSFIQKDFEDYVREETEEFNATILAGGDSSLATEINNAVTTLGLAYANEGMNYRDAIEKAAKEVVLDRYAIGKVNSGSFRIPIQFDKSAIEKGAAASLDGIAKDTSNLDLASFRQFGGNAASMFASMLKKSGRWVTAGDESGLVLFCGGSAVLDKSGKPITRAWAQLQKSATYYEKNKPAPTPTVMR